MVDGWNVGVSRQRMVESADDNQKSGRCPALTIRLNLQRINSTQRHEIGQRRLEHVRVEREEEMRMTELAGRL